jgi:hypothetical protein
LNLNQNLKIVALKLTIIFNACITTCKRTQSNMYFDELAALIMIDQSLEIRLKCEYKRGTTYRRSITEVEYRNHYYSTRMKKANKSKK